MSTVPLPYPGTRPLGEILKWVLNAERVRKITGAITGATEEAREADCSEVGDDTECNQCKLQEGALLPAIPRRAVRRENRINWDYQLQIANLHAGPERFTYCDKDTGAPLGDFDFSIAKRIWNAAKGNPQPAPEQLNVTEWFYNQIWFDGFWRSKCTVVDAKGRYSQWLDDEGDPMKGFPRIKVFPDLVSEARNQAGAIREARPQAGLEWHFMEPELYQWASGALPPDVTCVHTPYEFPMVQS